MHANVNHITYTSCTTQTKTLVIYAQITRPTAVIYVLIIEGILDLVQCIYTSFSFQRPAEKKHI